MESINSFSSGMNSDQSKTILNKETYLQALNFRGVTSLGDSNGSLVNVKGNELNIILPEVLDSYKLIVSETGTVGAAAAGNVTITINGKAVVLTVTPSFTGFDIYTGLLSLSNCYNTTNPTPTATEFAVSYVDNYVVIYQQPVYTLLTAAPTPLVITAVLGNAGTATTTIKFLPASGVVQTSQAAYVAGSNNLIIIGSQFIDEDIYLLSAVDDDTEAAPHPNDSFSNLGVIWKLSIDNVTRVSTLTLVYANLLDFTKFYPVAPTAILGRYESNNLQRLYWTDFYNTIRTLNVSDPQLFALSPALISVFPGVTMEIPLLDSFGVGTLNAGTYELGYRLKKTAGQISNYSQTSNMVHLLGDENQAFANYQGPTTLGSTGRSITWTLTNIDTAWDSMEFIILYRASKTDLPIIYVSPEQDITTTYTLASVTGFDTIVLDEYLSLSSGFTHAKTVETKDNILFWGNVRAIRQKEISSLFDARAFRANTNAAPGSEDIILKNEGTLTLAQAIATPKTNDSINEYYDSAGDYSTNGCYFKPGTSVLGGSGANISYEFGTDNILLCDLAVTQIGAGDWWLQGTQIPGLAYKSSGISVDANPIDLITSSPNDSDDQIYPLAGVGTSKNPYYTSVATGFQPEEIYRCAIQLFDLQGGYYFTEWIGDIKFPSANDTNSNPGEQATLAGVTNFRNSFLYNGQIWGQSLYIKFNVDVSAISQYISGYQIVRVERTTGNKTILGSGMLTNVFDNGDPTIDQACLGGGLWRENQDFPIFGSVPPYLQLPPYDPYPNQESLETLGQDITFNVEAVSSRLLTYDCFDFQLSGYSYQTGDKVFIRSKVNSPNYDNAQAGAADGRYRMLNPGSDTDSFINNPQTLGVAAQYKIPGVYGTKYQTGYDSEAQPYNMLFYVEGTTYDYTLSANNKLMSKGQGCNSGSEILQADNGVQNYLNAMRNYGPNSLSNLDGSPKISGLGADTILLSFDTAEKIESNGLHFNCGSRNKLMALYYRPNLNQYGGPTYANRTANEYIACGSFIPLNRDNQILINNKVLTHKVYGGDVFLNYWDHQKVIKPSSSVATDYRRYNQGAPAATNGNTLGLYSTQEHLVSSTYYFPCTNSNNQAVRFSPYHLDRDWSGNTYDKPDTFLYQSYHSNQKNVVKFIPKPFNFVIGDQWRNRIYYSNVKFDNEIQDSWSVYPINQFYDVEGNYGGITSLIALNQTLYFIQDKGVGMLSVNPQSITTDGTNAPIQLGVAEGIKKHYYSAIDSGSKHQWSVIRSSNTITFVDIRQKKIFLFNGKELKPISDIKGQRGFLNKRLHNNLINYDNPIIGKGLLTTYDYQNNEFLYTFKNNTDPVNTTNDENLTLSYSELQDSFVTMYSFLPNIYISNNRYLLSVNNDLNKKQVWLHNFGVYGSFYGTLYPSTLKLLVNDNPLYTKVFDNMIIMSEAIDDNVEWNDDLNIYPGSATNPTFPDDVNNKDSTFNSIRLYNQYQNTDFVTLTPGTNIRKMEQGFNLQLPRNKFDYDTYNPSVYSIFDPSKLTKTTFGERLRDKWMIADFKYDNLLNLRFIIHNIKTLLRISDR